MIQTIAVPSRGHSIREYTLIELRVAAGDLVRKDEELCLIESDKAVHSVASPVDGIVVEVSVSEGCRVVVGETLFVLEHSTVDEVPISNTLTNELPTHLVESDESRTPNLVLRPARYTDFDNMFDIWTRNQRLASRRVLNDIGALRSPFISMISKAKPPFCCLVALQNGAVVGWGTLLPCKNNPLTAHRVAEISIYVDDPDASVSSGSVLVKRLIRHARTSSMAFLLGFTNPDNSRVAVLLDSLGFQRLGAAGNPPTEIWQFSIE